MTDKQILEEAIHTRVPVSQDKAVSSIVDVHDQYTGMSPKETEVNQLGDYLRYLITFRDQSRVHRFVVSE